MNKPHNKEEFSRPGIYLIINTINHLVYVGKSINLYKRKCQYISIINGTIPSRIYNNRFINHLQRYGKDNFEFIILEFVEYNDELLAEAELKWIEYYKSNKKDTGYNLNINSRTKTIVSDETRLKISERLKKEWSDGKRKYHSKKLTDFWNNNLNRRKNQSSLMSNILTKYKYKITYPEKETIEMNYQQLKKNNLQNVIAEFKRKKSNIHKRKDGIIIERINIEDIVQSLVKAKE